MNIEYLLSTYGYWAILVGTFLEGESILVLGGLAAQHGYLTLPGVMLCAFAGSFAGDQLYFQIGRRYGKRFLTRYPRGWARVERIHGMLERYHTIFVLGFRFLYGLRTISPFVLGMSSISTVRFFILNMLGAWVWAIGLGGAGFLCGEVIQMLIGKAKKYEIFIFIGILLASGLVTLLTYLRQRCRDKQTLAQMPPKPPSSR